MINRKVDDAVFDAILKQAFCDAFAQEIEQIEAADDQPAKPSEVQRKQERRYYRKFQRKPVKVATILRGTAACLVALMGLSFCLMLTSAPVRAAMVDTVVSFFEKYLTVDMGKEDVLVVDGYTFAYVPYGYEIRDETKSALATRYTFSNGSEYFKVCIYIDGQQLLKYDNEQANTVAVKINGVDAYFTQSDDKPNSLIWTKNNQTIAIEGNLSLSVMKKIAENFS